MCSQDFPPISVLTNLANCTLSDNCEVGFHFSFYGDSIWLKYICTRDPTDGGGSFPEIPGES